MVWGMQREIWELRVDRHVGQVSSQGRCLNRTLEDQQGHSTFSPSIKQVDSSRVFHVFVCGAQADMWQT
jgi:hypothetical protein